MTSYAMSRQHELMAFLGRCQSDDSDDSLRYEID